MRGVSGRVRAAAVLVAVGLLGLVGVPDGPEARAEVLPVDPTVLPEGAVVVEQLGDRVVYAEPGSDGLTARIFDQPVAFEDESGAWQPIDPSITADADGSGFTNVAGPVGVEFAENANDAALVTLSDEAGSVAFEVAGATAAVPVVAGSTVVYADALGAGTDLEYLLSASELKEWVVLDAAPAVPPTYRFPLTLDGLTPRTAGDGSIRFEDAAGVEVMRVPLGIMADSSADESGDPATADVTPVLTGDATAGWAIEVSPEFGWLSDPARVFPVRVDPSYTWYQASYLCGSGTCDDASVKSDTPTTNYNGSGQFNGTDYVNSLGVSGSNTAQSFLHYDTSFLAGKVISAANWNGYWKSGTVNASRYYLKRITSNWSATGPTPAAVTWDTKPTVASANYAPTGKFAGEAWSAANVTTMVSNWAAGTWTNYGLRIDGGTTAWSTFLAQESGWPYAPFLEVTYNSTPLVPVDHQIEGVPIASGDMTTVDNALRPTFAAKVVDPDGATLHGVFTVMQGLAVIATGSGSEVASGGFSEWVPTVDLPAGSLWWYVHASDGSADSAISGLRTVIMDRTAPAAPSLSSATWTADAWSGPFESGTFSLSGPSDATSYWWDFDEGDTPGNEKLATSGAATLTVGGEGTPDAVVPAWGWHDLVVRAQDEAGNLSAPAHFTFGHGYGGITDRDLFEETQQFTTFTMNSKAAYDGVALYWLDPNAGATLVPPAEVTIKSGPDVGKTVTEAGGWPVKCNVDEFGACTGGVTRTYPTLEWNVSSTLGGKDGLIYATGIFYIGSAGQYLQFTPIADTVLDQKGWGLGSTIPAGPGELNPVTGNLTLSTTDANLGGLGISRSFQSREQNATGDVLGPGWSSGLAGFASYSHLVESDATVAIYNGDTLATTFARSGTGYTPEAGVEGLELTKAIGSGLYTLTEFGAQIYTFEKQSATDTYHLIAIDDITNSNAGSTDWEVVSGVVRPTQQVAPSASGVSCASTPTTIPGCRTLTFTYSTVTTATGTAEAGWGDYAGTLKKATYHSYVPDPGGPGVMGGIDVVEYAYDNTGQLRAVWDPRISPALKTKYRYNADGQVDQITRPGEQPVTVNYAPLSGEPLGTGRLANVQRPSLPSGTAQTTIAYDIPLSGTDSAYNMSATEVARWGQHDAPSDATAIFPPDQIPTTSPPSSYTRATVVYTNGDGQIVNVAQPGGGTSTAEQDEFGRSVRELSAGNRQTALDRGTSTQEEAAIAAELDSHRVFDADGLVTDEYGPAHVVTSDAGPFIRARAHSHTDYDEGAPGGGTFWLPTTTTATAFNLATGTDIDARVTKLEYAFDIDGDATIEADEDYGWDFGTPVRTIVDPTGLNLKTTTLYDTDTGALIERRLPAGPGGGTAASTRFFFYTAGTHPSQSACGGLPEWAGLACRTAPAAQPGTSGLPDMPVTTVTGYDRYDQPTETKDTSGTTTRTTTLTYDGAGRPWKHDVAASIGTDIAEIIMGYDAATGRPTTTNDGATTLTRSYDSLGRMTGYVDADGNTSAFTYDALDRPATVNDGKGTTTYSYDTGIEPRGLPTSIVDSAAGTFTAAYDIDGRITSQTYPGGLTASYLYDEAGANYALLYAKGTGTWPGFIGWTNIHGQRTQQWGNLSGQALTYDNAGRLIQVKDQPAGAGCTTRIYAFDSNTNRTALTTRSPNTDGTCAPSGGTTVNSTYDTADRAITTGYGYDDLGRTLVIPAAESPVGQATTLGYYVNDLTRTITNNSQTRTFNLDPARRYRNWTDTNGTYTNHYNGDGDSPAWTTDNTAGTNWTRHVTGFTGLAATQTHSGSTDTIKLQLSNLHGDIITTAETTDTTRDNALTETTEYGLPRSGGGGRYDYLGTHQRHKDTASGITLMGVRNYNPTSGRFASVDSVIGGNANSYDYVGAGPGTHSDLGGACRDRTENNPLGRLVYLGYSVWRTIAGAAISGEWHTEWQAEGRLFYVERGYLGLPIFAAERCNAGTLRIRVKNLDYLHGSTSTLEVRGSCAGLFRRVFSLLARKTATYTVRACLGQVFWKIDFEGNSRYKIEVQALMPAYLGLFVW